MFQGYAGRQRNGYVLTAIVGAHVAALTALALSKTQVFVDTFRPPLITENIPLDPPPPENVPPPPERRAEAQPQPQQRSDIEVVKPLIPIPSDGPVVTPAPFEDLVINTAPFGDRTVLADPPALPQPEPAPQPLPKIAPTKLKPRGNPGDWVTNEDYPAAALRSEEHGRTRFSLAVSADGRPTGCTITASSGSTTLDNAACRLLMRRARFEPGRDADGVATGGAYANSFNWQIPED